MIMIIIMIWKKLKNSKKKYDKRKSWGPPWALSRTSVVLRPHLENHWWSSGRTEESDSRSTGSLGESESGTLGKEYQGRGCGRDHRALGWLGIQGQGPLSGQGTEDVGALQLEEVEEAAAAMLERGGDGVSQEAWERILWGQTHREAGQLGPIHIQPMDEYALVSGDYGKSQTTVSLQ